MKLIQEKVASGRTKAAIILLFIMLVLSVLATLAIVCLMNLFVGEM